MNTEKKATAACPAGQGPLPSCASLAVPSVPMQQQAEQRYSQSEALAQGTLFPGLNLPFHLQVKGAQVPRTPLSELQALCFVVHELGLYLDTHPDDAEAFQLYQRYTVLAQEGRSRYVEQYGPLMQTDAALADHYNWLHDPWPWDYEEGK